MIWITKAPLPPSVNASLMPIPVKKRNTKTGRTYMGGGFTATPVMREFKALCKVFESHHREALKQIGAQCQEWIDKGYQLQVDAYFCFEHSRIFSVPNEKVLQIDANNRLKAGLDALSTWIGVDDKHIFTGLAEKITSKMESDSCMMLRIAPFKPRTLSQIRAIMLKESQVTSS